MDIIDDHLARDVKYWIAVREMADGAGDKWPIQGSIAANMLASLESRVPGQLKRSPGYTNLADVTGDAPEGAMIRAPWTPPPTPSQKLAPDSRLAGPDGRSDINNGRRYAVTNVSIIIGKCTHTVTAPARSRPIPLFGRKYSPPFRYPTRSPTFSNPTLAQVTTYHICPRMLTTLA
jgi:hypothetical protein